MVSKRARDSRELPPLFFYPPLEKNEQKKKEVLFTTYRDRDREVEEETLTQITPPAILSSLSSPSVPYSISGMSCDYILFTKKQKE